MKTLKRFGLVLAMAILVTSFSIPFTMFPSKVYADPIAIGDSYEGGKVAYIFVEGDPGYSAGIRYLIAAINDSTGITGIIWAIAGNQSTSVPSPGALETAKGKGRSNTDAIVAQNGAGSTYAAGLARACSDGGYSDWFLPSKDELQKIWENLAHAIPSGVNDIDSYNKAISNNFTWSGYYWSSSESSATTAYQKRFAADDQYLAGSKSTTYRVRAVRYVAVKPTGLTVTAPTSASNNDGIINGVTEYMEYKLKTADSYTAVTAGATSIEGLAAGIYYVRYKGYSAEPTEVTVGDVGNNSGSSTPTLTPDEWVDLDLNIDQSLNHHGPNPTGFLGMLYDNSMQRIPDAPGLNYWNEQLDLQIFGANFVTEHFIFSDEIGSKVAAMTSEEYVTFLYSTLFARIPDTDGYNNWLGYINSGFSKEETLSAFLNNEEWVNICKSFNVIP